MSANAAGERARERLLDAAERLIAVHGFEVSLRQIAREAGQRNNSAVTYHFGSRAGLIEAVWDRRTERVNARRARLLEQAQAVDPSMDLHRLMTIHVEPMVEEIGSSLPSYWARFNQAALAQMPLMFLAHFDDDLAAYTDREVPLRTLSYVFHLMRKSVDGGSEPNAGVHVALAVRFVIAGLASWERDQELGLLAPESLRPLAEGLISMGAQMLSHPHSRLGEAMGLLEI